MSKIICDVCGTRYPESAEQCPICGHIRETAGKTAADVLIMDEVQHEHHEKVRGGRFSKSNVRKRTEHAVSYEAAPAKSKPKAPKKTEKVFHEQADEDIFVEDTHRDKANTILNILLVIVILALLAVTGYIFVAHFLPNMSKPEPTDAPIATQLATAEPTETEEPTIPCEELVLEETEILLTEYEQKWLINVDIKPADTTDELTFTSADELIASVDSEGCVTARAEGQTTITITCGDVQQEYTVACVFPGIDVQPGETLPPPTDPPPTEPPKEMKVTTNYVNVRSGPATGYDKVRQCHTGDKILVYEVKDVDGVLWGRLEDGWICLKYAKEVN